MSKAQTLHAPNGVSAPDQALHLALLDAEDHHAAGSLAGQRSLLETLRQRQARLASQAAQELMAPLAAQRVAAEAGLRDGATLEQLENAVVAMLEEGRRMQQLIDGLLLMAQADSGMLGTPHAIIDACGVAAEAVQCIEPLADLRQQRLALHLSGVQFIKADAAVLRQVLLNLVHDATAHAPAGSRIVVSVVGPAGGEVEISVAHDGWAQEGLGSADTPPPPGLGLTIARSLVRWQGGTWSVAGTPGHGTLVRLGFPRCQAPVPQSGPRRWKRRAGDR